MLERYYLPENKSEASPGNIMFFDTESHFQQEIAYETGQYHRLRLGCAIAGRLERGVWTREKRCEFRSAEQFWEFVAECSHPRIPLWLFAHNIGYDLLTTCFPEMLCNGTFRIFDPVEDKTKIDILGQKYKKTTGFLCTENPPNIISVKHCNGWKLTAIDTFNFWVTSLAKIGEMVGKQKTEMPKYEASDRQWFDYCMQDVEVLKTAVLGLIGWVKDNDLGKFRFTAPSQAMAAFRHRFMQNKILCHNNVTLRTFERQAYYGGRLECFYVGDVNQKCYELDVTSLYPSVMLGALYPHSVKKWFHSRTHTYTTTPQLGLDYIAEVKLKTAEQFPRRDTKIGTIYPVGEYWTTLAGPELVRALELGAVREVGNWAQFELCELFTPFVNWFWQYRLSQKEAGNKLNADLAKLLMNGLYGKFGQKTNAWTDRPDMTPGEQFIWTAEASATTGEIDIFRTIGPCVQQWTGKQEHPYAFPAIAAYVTAYARERMYGLRQIAGKENTYYLVTDALFCNQAGYERLVEAGQLSETELGLLRVKHESEKATFKTLHHYQIGEHCVAGSKKKSARKQEDGSYLELQFESFDKALKRKPDGSVHVKPLRKTYSTEYTRGTILETGWVKPILIIEE